MTVFAVVGTPEDEARVKKLLPYDVYLSLYNLSYHKDKKKAYQLMTEYGSTETPFLLIDTGLEGLQVHPIYKEHSKDPIRAMVDWIDTFRFNNEK